LLALATVTAVVVTGCSGGNGNGNGNKTDNAGGNANGGSKQAKTEFLFWSPFSGADGPFMKQIVDKYNASQDQYSIDFVIQPSGEYYKQLDVALSAAKDSPDLIIMHLDQIPTYQQKDQLQALDGIATNAGLSKDDYV